MSEKRRRRRRRRRRKETSVDAILTFPSGGIFAASTFSLSSSLSGSHRNHRTGKEPERSSVAILQLPGRPLAASSLKGHSPSLEPTGVITGNALPNTEGEGSLTGLASCPYRIYLLGVSCISACKVFIQPQNNLVQTSKARRSAVRDPSPFRIKVRVPW